MYSLLVHWPWNSHPVRTKISGFFLFCSASAEPGLPLVSQTFIPSIMRPTLFLFSHKKTFGDEAPFKHLHVCLIYLQKMSWNNSFDGTLRAKAVVLTRGIVGGTGRLLWSQYLNPSVTALIRRKQKFFLPSHDNIDLFVQSATAAAEEWAFPA